MANYGLVTSAKINHLINIINAHPDWGSAKLQSSIRERFGSELRKQYLLKEARDYRQSKGIEEPRIAYSDYSHIKKVLREGHYIQREVDQVIQQVSRYTAEGRYNFAHSETLKESSKNHQVWFDGLVKEARKDTKNLKEAMVKVSDNLANLIKLGQFDPFSFLQEVEKPNVIISGMIKIRPLKRDYTEARRAQALRKREIAGQKVLR